MEGFRCDYECTTVGESIMKYDIPDDWCAEFDIYDGAYPIICVPVAEICKIPAMMGLQLRVVEDQNNEYAGCMVLTNQKTIIFKIESINDLTKGLEAKPGKLGLQK